MNLPLSRCCSCPPHLSISTSPCLVLFALYRSGFFFLQDVVNDVVQMIIDVIVAPSRSVGEEVTVITPCS